jgi:hypothetical protein
MPRIKRLSGMRQRPTQWTMVDRIPKKQICLVVGKYDQGKSTFASWLTAALTTGMYPSREGTMEQHEPMNVYFNNVEDPLYEVMAGRLRVAGAVEERVVLEQNEWELPDDLGLLRDRIEQMTADGFAPGAVILDPLGGHFRNPGHGFVKNKEAMAGLINIAQRHDLSFILPHHFVKGVRHAGTVMAAIGGMSVLQNTVKAIYIFGPPAGGEPTRAFAKQKMNYGRPPVTLHFQPEIVEKTIRRTRYEMIRLNYLGPIDATAADIFDAAKFDERGSQRTGVQEAGEFIRERFRDSEYHAHDDPSMKLARIADLVEGAQLEGVWYSKGTFDRAKGSIGVRPVRASELDRLLGDQSVSDRKGWAKLRVEEEGESVVVPLNRQPKGRKRDREERRR